MSRLVYPIDPECPAVEQYRATVIDDPMNGCPEDFWEDFQRRHPRACVRCQAYGLANVEVE